MAEEERVHRPMRVLFLDIDEVLNSKAHPGSSVQGFEHGDPEYYAQGIDPFHVKSLNQITEATGALIVISSSWRNAHPLNKLRQIFRCAGITGTVIGDTPIRLLEDGERRYRYDEIQAWLDAVHPDAYVILDDVDMGPLSDHHVQTTYDDGLLPEHVEVAVRILGGS